MAESVEGGEEGDDEDGDGDEGNGFAAAQVEVHSAPEFVERLPVYSGECVYTKYVRQCVLERQADRQTAGWIGQRMQRKLLP